MNMQTIERTDRQMNRQTNLPKIWMDGLINR